jgi:hypothetical protein
VAIDLWKAKILVKARRDKLKINLRSPPRIVKFTKNQKQRSNDQDGQLPVWQEYGKLHVWLAEVIERGVATTQYRILCTAMYDNKNKAMYMCFYA